MLAQLRMVQPCKVRQVAMHSGTPQKATRLFRLHLNAFARQQGQRIGMYCKRRCIPAAKPSAQLAIRYASDPAHRRLVIFSNAGTSHDTSDSAFAGPPLGLRSALAA